MRVLILGSAGMLGHKLYQVLAPDFNIVGTIQGQYRDIGKYDIFREDQIVPGINALEIKRVESVIDKTKPQVIINCIGIIKQLEQSNDRLLSIWVNALLPHQLQQICKERGTRMIHISTDCVFSGERGNYSEDALSDANDIYGKTKYLGEVNGEGALTIRTSLIGRELATKNGLVEWLLSNQGGEVNGFTEVIFSGFPTLHLARIIRDIVDTHQNLSGIYHISSEPISKFRLLTLMNDRMNLKIKINAYSSVHCDRSLDSTLYRKATGFKPLTWDKMLGEFATDALQYEKWRR